MPTAGGLHKSLLSGREIGCTAVQLFTGSPRQWTHPPLAAEAVARFREAQEQTGIAFTVAHDSYLINLAAPDAFLLERSRHAFRGELDRAELLGIPWVVTHMGAHLDKGEAEAIARLVESLKQILDETEQEGYRVGVALETTAGQGTGLGWRFEQLGEVLQGVGDHPRLGVCLDTCHVFAAGYDLRTPETYDQAWTRFADAVGLEKLKVIHVNDSKKPLGSRVDRHEHIGDGEIGLAAFDRLVNDPCLKPIPLILETPDSDAMHAVNLRRLKRLAAGKGSEILVSVQFFGRFSDLFPDSPLELSLPAGACVRDLTVHLAERNARLIQLETHCRFAVDEEYAALDQALHEGARVAVLPPMSGAEEIMAHITIDTKPIDVQDLEAKVSGSQNGAVCTFIGQVRRHSRGREVAYLEYQAYVPMAEKQMRRIAEEAEARWGCEAAIQHRIGKIELGEASVVIVVGSPHRAEAFEACRYCIDALKETVPIWKREVCPDGTYWIEGDEALKAEPEE